MELKNFIRHSREIRCFKSSLGDGDIYIIIILRCDSLRVEFQEA